MSDPHAAPDVMGKDQEDPDAGSTWTWFLAGGVIFVAIAIAVAALYYDMTDRRIQSVQVATEVSDVEALRAGQRERLTGDARRELRQDTPEGAIVIPIDAAMDLTLEDLSGR